MRITLEYRFDYQINAYDYKTEYYDYKCEVKRQDYERYYGTITDEEWDVMEVEDFENDDEFIEWLMDKNFNKAHEEWWEEHCECYTSGGRLLTAEEYYGGVR